MSTLAGAVPAAEWLEADGLGGFASGTVAGWRTRRYHGLLVPALRPPVDRQLLVASLDAWPDTGAGACPVSAHRYLPDVTYPRGDECLVRFEREPWPTWTWRYDDGSELVQELFVPYGQRAVVMHWRGTSGSLRVRPLLAARDLHSLHHENGALRMDADVNGELVRWRPYAEQPEIAALANSTYRHDPVWYRSFLLGEERARGFEFAEDLASPGELRWDLTLGDAVLVLAVEGAGGVEIRSAQTAASSLAASELDRRARFPSALERAGDAYLVGRDSGRTIIAGYPWFTDWGRDTFIALRGLCLATGRLDEARSILLEWAGAAEEGMLPNRFVDHGEAPEFNSVDASLWFVVAVYELLAALQVAGRAVDPGERAQLLVTVDAILEAYEHGTRYGIGADPDGLLRAGIPGSQLTWMDARIGERPVTPRAGKPVEVQALWINALQLDSAVRPHRAELATRAATSFRERFWNAEAGCLYDVVDPDGRVGEVDATIRPNQILALGGLPRPLLPIGPEAHGIVALVERLLWTPLGLRSLSPGDPAYCPHYLGGPEQRDGAYHQGTVWPWLAGPFVEAWVRVHGSTPEGKAEARARFVQPLLDHLEAAGLGHVSEIADGDEPHTPRGCPFQAWSVGELLRLREAVVNDDRTVLGTKHT